MSFILDALKRAEQKGQWRKAPQSSTVEPPIESPGWEVKMVSPARFERVRAGDAAEQKGNGLSKGVGIAAAILVLLLLMECAVIYEVRGRMSAIATEVSKLTRQISETEARFVKKEGERLSLKIENDSLRQELEVAGADLARARDAVRELKAKQEQVTARNRRARATDRKRSVAAPLVFGPPSPTTYRPPRTGRPSRLDMADTSSVTTYSIR